MNCNDGLLGAGGRRRRYGACTLLEVMVIIVVLAVIALIGAAVMFAASQRVGDGRHDTALNAQTLCSAVALYRAQYPNDLCPGMEELIHGDFLYRQPVDDWDRDYRIACHEHEVVVTSAGGDGQFGNDDDIVRSCASTKG